MQVSISVDIKFQVSVSVEILVSTHLYVQLKEIASEDTWSVFASKVHVYFGSEDPKKLAKTVKG